jgi:hypothetical protein
MDLSMDLSNDLSNTYYQFYFKLAYTCETKNYSVKSDITVKKFIDKIKKKARNDFNIRYNEDVELVETGHYDNINGIDAEKATALEPSNFTLSEKYGNLSQLPSFYIRIIRRSLVVDLTNE